jgi:FtsP/CotA-like multicopper oxidase with cupredoxin domain
MRISYFLPSEFTIAKNSTNFIIRWFDGVPGVQQCPIAPNGTFTYSFLADLYGTSWWHSHYSAQYNAGIFGPMIIHGPQTTPYDIGQS